MCQRPWVPAFRVNCDPSWNPIFLDVCEDTLPWQMCNVQEQLKHFLLREHWNITAVLSKKSDRCNLRWAPGCRWFLKPDNLPDNLCADDNSPNSRWCRLDRWTRPHSDSWWHAAALRSLDGQFSRNQLLKLDGMQVFSSTGFKVNCWLDWSKFWPIASRLKADDESVGEGGCS